jgi:hypothetical protein
VEGGIRAADSISDAREVPAARALPSRERLHTQLPVPSPSSARLRRGALAGPFAFVGYGLPGMVSGSAAPGILSYGGIRGEDDGDGVDSCDCPARRGGWSRGH